MDLKHQCERYQCTLSDEDLAVAVGELNEPEDNDERLRRIDNLRNDFHDKNKHMRLIRSDDEFMLRFLRAKKFHHCRALAMLTNYHIKLYCWPEVYKKMRNPQLIKHVFDAGVYVVLREKAKDGSAVTVARPGIIENSSFEEFMAANLVSQDRLLDDERVQIYGITKLVDMSAFNFAMVKQVLSLKIIKQIVAITQNVMPVRLRCFFFLNSSPTVSFLYTLFMRPLMKEKFRKRYKVCGKTFEALHEIVDFSVLPPAYGGTGDPLDGILAESWRNTIFDT